MRIYRQKVELSQGNERADDRRQLGGPARRSGRRKARVSLTPVGTVSLAHILSVLSLSTECRMSSKSNKLLEGLLPVFQREYKIRYSQLEHNFLDPGKSSFLLARAQTDTVSHY